MLRQQAIRVGGTYVNERDGHIREVVEELDRFRVRVNEFDLRTGRLVAPPLRLAYKRHLHRWANREATPEELVRLHPRDMNRVVPRQEGAVVSKIEREHSRARLEQVVASNVMHRW